MVTVTTQEVRDAAVRWLAPGDTITQAGERRSVRIESLRALAALNYTTACLRVGRG